LADLYLPVLYGSVRQPRHSLGVARYVHRLLGARPGVETRLFDPEELPFPNLVQREWEQESPDPRLVEFVREMGRADGFVLVTPEYNFGIPGALKNLLDHLFDEWNRKPFALVTAGGVSGGFHASDQLRIVVSGLGAISVPRHVPVQFVQESYDESGPKRDAEVWAGRFDRLFEELEWYARALSAARTAPR
jgi:NAD(P)H-dependent FMN reductase